MEQKNKTRLIAVAFNYDGKKIGYLSTDYSITENINNAYISDFEDLTNIVKKIKDVFFSFSEYMLSVSFFDKNLNVYYTGEFKNLNTAGTAGIKACGDMSKDTCAAHEAHESLAHG